MAFRKTKDWNTEQEKNTFKSHKSALSAVYAWEFTWAKTHNIWFIYFKKAKNAEKKR